MCEHFVCKVVERQLDKQQRPKASLIKNCGAIFEQGYELSVARVYTATLAQVCFHCPLILPSSTGNVRPIDAK